MAAEHPRGTDGLWVVILSFIKEWLRVTVIRTRTNEHFARSFRLFHGGEKMDGGLHCTGIFAAEMAAFASAGPRTKARKHFICFWGFPSYCTVTMTVVA